MTKFIKRAGKIVRVGVSGTSYLVRETPANFNSVKFIECTDGVANCGSICLTFTVFANVNCSSCNCNELNGRNAYLINQGDGTWVGGVAGFVIKVEQNGDGTLWLLTIHCDSLLNDPCSTFTQPVSGTCPSESWTFFVGCFGSIIGGPWIRPQPDPDGTPCTLGSCCNYYNIVISNFTGNSICGSCPCATFNGTYPTAKGDAGDAWVGVNSFDFAGTMQCIDSTWYFTVQCPLTLACVQFTAPDVDTCPPEDDTWVLDPDFGKGCHIADAENNPSMTITSENCATSIQYEDCSTPASFIYVDPTILSDDNPYPSTVEIGGVCYQFSETSDTAIDTFSIDSEPVDCDGDACFVAPTSCPTDCSGCPATQTITYSGNSGVQCNQGQFCNSFDAGSPYLMTRGGGSSCSYTGGFTLECGGFVANTWHAYPGGIVCVRFDSPNLTGCPALGAYSIITVNCGSAVLVVS